MTTEWTIERTEEAAASPVDLNEAKRHLNLSVSDSTHDSKLVAAIEAATEQVEQDTDLALIDQTFVLYRDRFPTGSQFSIPKRPLISVSGITYYDSDNTQQTLSTDVYLVDTSRRQIALKYDQEWPEITEQRNGIAITALCGHGGSASFVPRLTKQAILLQIGAWFYDPAMEDPKRSNWHNAYQRIIARLIRSSYP